jgi:transposase-like protein
MSALKEVLGMWIAKTESTKFWLQVVAGLKNRVFSISVKQAKVVLL